MNRHSKRSGHWRADQALGVTVGAIIEGHSASIWAILAGWIAWTVTRRQGRNG